jgi:hypothetical protein
MIFTKKNILLLKQLLKIHSHLIGNVIRKHKVPSLFVDYNWILYFYWKKVIRDFLITMIHSQD